MSPVWLVPCTLVAVTAVVAARSARAVRSETAALSEHLREMTSLRDRAGAVQAASQRTAQAAEVTLGALAPPAPQ